METQRTTAEEVPNHLRSFLDAFDRGDARHLAELFAEDAVLDCGGGQLVTGRQAIRGALTSFLVHGLKLELDVLETIEAGSVACVRADWSMRGMNRMNQTINLAGRALHVLARTPSGGWEIKIYNPFSQAY